MKNYLLLLWIFSVTAVSAQQEPLSARMTATAMRLWPDSFLLENDKQAKWRYDQGVILKGVEGVWMATANGKWFNYLQKSMDFYIQEDGAIRGYKPDEYNIDHINNGKILLTLFKVTGKEKYRKAADKLRAQLLTHPRTSEGGFWHKKIYPSQMWLDGLFMAQPFYAEYAKTFGEDTTFNDIARQFILMEKHARDAKTGLLYHGWDESREQQWANKQTGVSPHFWARSLGWYGMALVDALDYFPAQHPQRAKLIAILHRLAVAVVKVQDPVSGVWYDIPDLPKQKGNYLEASASCMLAYTLAKGVRMGYLPASFNAKAIKAYAGIQKQFIQVAADGTVALAGTVAVSGLGGKPYRDGSFAYYMSEPVIVNDPKGIGAFILCAVEMEKAVYPAVGKGKTVLLDRFFNSEKRKNAAGKNTYWHYVWEERSHPGFSMLGSLFTNYGARLASLDSIPTANQLKNAAVYIIVDPDHLKDNPTPNYMTAEAAGVISNWVKAGGVLLFMANDSTNCELQRFNLLAEKFGMRFTLKSVNMVKDDVYQMGEVFPDDGNGIFGKRKMFLKETSTIDLVSPARAIATKNGDVLIATAKYGKGAVVAVSDPWLYDEYVDGRRLPVEFENFGAASDLVKWLLQQSKK